MSPLNLGSPICPLMLLPLTARSPRYPKSFCARFWLPTREKSSGVSSIKVVQQFPAIKVGCVRRDPRKGIFVFTPRMRNSTKARSIFRRTISYVDAKQVHFTSIES